MHKTHIKRTLSSQLMTVLSTASSLVLTTGCSKLTKYSISPQEPKMDLAFLINTIPFPPRENPVFFKDEEGRNVVHYAALNNQLAVLKDYLSSQGVKDYDTYDNSNNCYNILLNEQDNDGFTPLHLAAKKGHIDIVNELVNDEGVNVNKTNNDQATALHLAARQGHDKVVQVLLGDKDTQVNAQAKFNLTPLHWAARRGNDKVVRFLLSAPDIQVNAQTTYTWTPLHFAAYEGHEEVVRLLLTAPNIQVNAKTRFNITPLHIAIEEGHQNVVKLLS